MGSMTQAIEATATAEREAVRGVQDATATDGQADKLAMVAQRNGYKNVAERNAAAALAHRGLEEAREVLRVARQAATVAREALTMLRERRYASRQALIQALLPRADLHAEYRIPASGSMFGTNWDTLRIELQVVELDESGAIKRETGRSYDGHEFTYPVIRSSFSATVTAPERRVTHERHGDGETLVWKAAMVNWPSIGSQPLAETALFIEVLQAAHQLAAFLDRIAPTWAEEDDAD